MDDIKDNFGLNGNNYSRVVYCEQIVWIFENVRHTRKLFGEHDLQVVRGRHMALCIEQSIWI